MPPRTEKLIEGRWIHLVARGMKCARARSLVQNKSHLIDKAVLYLGRVQQQQTDFQLLDVEPQLLSTAEVGEEYYFNSNLLSVSNKVACFGRTQV